MPQSPPICDYEESSYRTDFWEGRARDYEDAVERHVLRRLLPPGGCRLLEVGAGFGRLTPEYRGFEQVVLLDYSFSQLQDARQQLGDDGYLYVVANAYQLPFRPGVFDGVTVIRVIHHIVDAPTVLREIRRVMVPGGTFILEFANKRNLKAMLRYALGRQDWSPYDPAPVEMFVKMNFDFHPAYIASELQKAGFEPGERIPVSFFRLGVLKRALPTGLLVGMDGAMQRTGLLYSPSVFTRNRAIGESPHNLDAERLFVCPETGDELHHEGDSLVSRAGRRWPIQDGIYVFKR